MTKARGRSAPTAARRPAGSLRPHPSTFGHLATIIGEAYREPELARMLEKAGAGRLARRGLSKQESLYCVLAGLHESGAHGTMTKILVAACGPGAGGKSTRVKINRYLGPGGLRIGEGGRVVRVGRAPVPKADKRAFGQRNYHPLVIGHAREKFLKGEYSVAVTEACKALEGLVRAKSGVDGHGNHLMRRAFGDDGTLEVALPGLEPSTRENLRRGLRDMCAGIVSNVRNPLAHETELRFHVGRLEALDILSTISYLCWEVDLTRRRRAARTPRRGGARRAGRRVARAAAGTGAGRAP
ncbi:MAG: TIGR02391 family protein [Thaumarchaeota archaeon]|nr:TIGR02391 family protein [Nitrososphaerota archaeon]